MTCSFPWVLTVWPKMELDTQAFIREHGKAMTRVLWQHKEGLSPPKKGQEQGS